MSSIMKFTDGVRAAVITAVKMGVSLEAAATTAGVDRTTLWRWLRQGTDDEANGLDTEHARFTKAFREAEAQIMGQVEANVVQASSGDWRAGAWVLSHRRPDRYGKDGTAEIANQLATKLLDLVHARCSKEAYQEVLETPQSRKSFGCCRRGWGRVRVSTSVSWASRRLSSRLC